MKKISTLFLKDPTNLSRVINVVDPSNEWVLTHGIATIKYDGTACAIINNELYKRHDVKKGKSVPDGAIPCQEADVITGHHPHWVKVTSSDKYHLEALTNKGNNITDATYELVGPKVQSNPHGFDKHILIMHGSNIITDLDDYTFEGIKQYLTNNNIEGIVFHHTNLGDTRMCKIRRKDFGLPWPFIRS
jgi:hypothetical protein